MSRANRVPLRALSLFASLYALQGVTVAYLVNFNKQYMINAGVDDRMVARVQTAVLLPLVFKFLFGPISDRFSLFGLGHRRPYILLGLLLQAGGLLGLSLVDPARHLGLFASFAVGAVIGMSLFDTCCDGMVVDMTPDGDRARVQGTLMVSRFLATMLCTIGFGAWVDSTGLGPGWSPGLLWVCAALGVIPLVQTITVHEPVRPNDAESFRWSALGVIFRPRSLVLLAFGAGYGMLATGVELNLPLYYTSLEFSSADVGWLGATRYLGRASGAILLPIVSRSIGRRGLLAAGILGLAITSAGQSLVDSHPTAGFWSFGFGVANGWNDALFCVLAMEASDPSMAASTFALFMAVSNLSVAGDALFVESLTAAGHRYATVLTAFGAAGLGLLPLIPWLASPSPSARLVHGETT